MGDVIRSMNAVGYTVRGGEDEEVAAALNAALTDEKKSDIVGSLIAYNSGDSIQMIGLESLDNHFTNNVLERLGFSWPETGSAYVRRFLEKLTQKGFFTDDDE